MQARVDWALIIFGTQVIKAKRPVRPVFPDYLSVSCDYGFTESFQCFLYFKFEKNYLKNENLLQKIGVPQLEY